jgi:hypothetical protein
MMLRPRFLTFALLFLVSPLSWSQNLPTSVAEINEKTLAYAKEAIQLYGDQIPAHIQKEILAQQITLGMSPYEAKLAGGAFYFKVEADPKKWPPNADPYEVISKQSTNPDDSKIWMTFETSTQFPEKGLTKFTVFFGKGKAVSIDNDEIKN